MTRESACRGEVKQGQGNKNDGKVPPGAKNAQDIEWKGKEKGDAGSKTSGIH